MWRVVSLACLLAAVHGTALLPNPQQRQLGGKIVGGEDADISAVPWQVSIEKSSTHACGGCIVHVRWVMSAAQCAQDPIARYSIRAGTSIKGAGGTVHQVIEKHINSYYNSDNLDYDFALFRVTVDFVFGPTISAVSLPFQGQETSAGSGATASGWGNKEGDEVVFQLQLVYMPVTSMDICRTAFGANLISDRMICAGMKNGGLGSCKLDEGGPLVVQNQLVGIYSWTHNGNCGAVDYYSVYSKVSSVRNWITDILPSGVARSTSNSLVLSLSTATLIVYSLFRDN